VAGLRTVVDHRDAADMVGLRLSVYDPASVLGEQPAGGPSPRGENPRRHRGPAAERSSSASSWLCCPHERYQKCCHAAGRAEPIPPGILLPLGGRDRARPSVM